MFPYEIINTPSCIGRDKSETGKRWLSENDTLREKFTSNTECEKLELSPSSENRFFADSPYYDAFVEKEIHSTEVLSDLLKEIGTEAEIFGKATETMFKSLNSLSTSCRKFSARAQHNEDHTGVKLGSNTDILNALGETLEEISASQKDMFDAIVNSLGYQFLELSVKQAGAINKLKRLKKTSDTQTMHSEQEMSNYLNGKNAAGTSKHLNRKNAASNSENCTLPPPPKELKFFAPKRKRALSSEGERPKPIRGRPPLRSSKSFESSRSFGSSQRLSHELHWSQKIRMEETTAELKRYQLVKAIIDANYEQRLALNHSFEEIIEATQSCFQLCSQKLDSMSRHLSKDQKQCLDFQEKEKPLWEEREKLLMQTLTTTKRAGEISLPNGNPTEELTKMECDAHIWDLPYELANVSKFRRSSAQDVLMEGWLYQKFPSMLSLQVSWTRRWFILKSDGIYYLESITDGRISDEYTSSKKLQVKLFDFALSTVREVPTTAAARFCFELINSSSKSIFLQARGPKELRTWLDRIRSAVGSQIAKIKKDAPSIPRRRDEINFASEDRHSWHVGDGEKDARLSELQGSAAPSTTAETKCEEYIENPIIRQALKANPKCADCGKDSPDWASLNLGILVCLECSGVHRSLGCHISKVRSLTLDTLSDAEASLLLSLGNERANRIWEQGITPETKILKKAASIQNRTEREDWIKRKYLKKEFLDSGISLRADSQQMLSQRLHAASKRGDVIGVASALAHGARLDGKHFDEEYATCTALGISVMRAHDGKDGAVECAELLFQNGAKLSAMDEKAANEKGVAMGQAMLRRKNACPIRKQCMAA